MRNMQDCNTCCILIIDEYYRCIIKELSEKANNHDKCHVI